MLVYDTALEELTGDELVAIAAVEEGEEAGDDETVNPVLPTGGDIIYAVIFFVALWAAMKYVLLPPIQKVRAERAAKIASARDAADNASADMGTAQADYDAAIADARAEAASILEAARAEADAARAEVVGAAESEAADLRAAADLLHGEPGASVVEATDVVGPRWTPRLETRARGCIARTSTAPTT